MVAVQIYADTPLYCYPEVKYFNPITNLLILRCDRDYTRQVGTESVLYWHLCCPASIQEVTPLSAEKNGLKLGSETERKRSKQYVEVKRFFLGRGGGGGGSLYCSLHSSCSLP